MPPDSKDLHEPTAALPKTSTPIQQLLNPNPLGAFSSIAEDLHAHLTALPKISMQSQRLRLNIEVTGLIPNALFPANNV